MYGGDDRARAEVFGRDRRDGRRHILTLHGAVTDGDDLVERVVLFLHHNLHRGACLYCYGLEAHIRDLQSRARLYIQGEMTIEIGYCARMSAGSDDRSTNDGLIVGIDHRSRHFACLGKRWGSEQNHEEHGQ